MPSRDYVVPSGTIDPVIIGSIVDLDAVTDCQVWVDVSGCLRLSVSCKDCHIVSESEFAKLSPADRMEVAIENGHVVRSYERVFATVEQSAKFNDIELIPCDATRPGVEVISGKTKGHGRQSSIVAHITTLTSVCAGPRTSQPVVAEAVCDSPLAVSTILHLSDGDGDIIKLYPDGHMQIRGGIKLNDTNLRRIVENFNSMASRPATLPNAPEIPTKLYGRPAVCTAFDALKQLEEWGRALRTSQLNALRAILLAPDSIQIDYSSKPSGACQNGASHTANA